MGCTPRSSAISMHEGIVAQRAGHLNRAASAYRRALTQHPGLRGAENNLGVVSLARDALPQALAHFEAELGRGHEVAFVRLNHAIARLRMGDRAGAVKEATPLAALAGGAPPKTPEAAAVRATARVLLAAAAAGAGRHRASPPDESTSPEDLARALEPLLTPRPGTPPLSPALRAAALRVAGHLAARAQDWDRASRALEDAAKLRQEASPEGPGPEDLDPAPPPTPGPGLGSATRAASSGAARHADGRSTRRGHAAAPSRLSPRPTRAASVREPGGGWGLDIPLRAALALRAGAVDRALALTRGAVAALGEAAAPLSAPETAWAALLHAHAMARGGDEAGAEELLDRLLATTCPKAPPPAGALAGPASPASAAQAPCPPPAVDALRLRAALRSARGAWAAALADLDAVWRVAPGAPGLLVDQATALAHLGRVDEARAAAAGALQRAPGDPRARALVRALR